MEFTLTVTLAPEVLELLKAFTKTEKIRLEIERSR